MGARLPPPTIKRTDVIIETEKAEAKIMERVRLIRDENEASV